MTDLPWMQIYVGDELAETAHLSPEEYGAHMLLRLHQWKHGELPTDEERLRRICRVDIDRWKPVRDILAPLFDWQWHHARTAETRKASEEKHANLSRNGKLGGRPKKADGKPMESQGFDRLKADVKADEKQSPSPSQPPSYSHSPSRSPSAPDVLALEKGSEEENTREGILVPFPTPRTPEEGKRFLIEKGAPPEEFEKSLRMLMAGHLSPYDIEHWATGRSQDEEAAA
ncbi:MAG: DUF1376 domain-containing protein [Rhizobium sp.]|nr:DUF1376 domain-containing protein [Rhizobium sp.]